MIKILKLITGEEIIGDVTRTDNFFTIKKPCALQFVPSRTNPEQPAMGLFPYAAFVANQTINVKVEHVIFEEEPLKELYNQYNSVFGNGLVVASGSL